MRTALAPAAPFSYELPYWSKRAPILARQAVATSHPLAAQAGLYVLEEGGNAIDAAIAVAATLAVVEPTMNGLGGDAFSLVWDGAALHGLNASGRAPRAWTRARFAGRERMPELGWDAVTVPGAVSGWTALFRRFGSLPFARLLAPAIRYAREGFPVMPATGALWADAPRRFAGFAEFARTFLPAGRAPSVGSWMHLPDAADTLESLAASEGTSFYHGEIAQRIADAARAEGGALTLGDLAGHQAAWVDPISVAFGDARLHELPPNGQGLAALIALGILPATDLYLAGHGEPGTRSLAPFERAVQAGVRVAIANNNVANPFAPFGNGNLLQAAWLTGITRRAAIPASRRALLDSITTTPATILGLPPHGPAPGLAAHLALLDTLDPADTVLQAPAVLATIRSARLTYAIASPQMMTP